MATKLRDFQNMKRHQVSKNKPTSTRPTLTQRNDIPVLRTISLLKVIHAAALPAVSEVQQENCPLSIKYTVSLLCVIILGKCLRNETKIFCFLVLVFISTVLTVRL